MRFYTKLFKVQLVTSIFLFAWILILLLITINHTLSCVDRNGKLKEWCKGGEDFDLKTVYKVVIERASRK